MMGTAEASSPQVRNPIRPTRQVARSAPRTLSRWRHGFEPRWDYGTDQGERATSRDRALAVYPTVYPAPQSEVGVVDLFASLYVVVTRSRGGCHGKHAVASRDAAAAQGLVFPHAFS